MDRSARPTLFSRSPVRRLVAVLGGAALVVGLAAAQPLAAGAQPAPKPVPHSTAKAKPAHPEQARCSAVNQPGKARCLSIKRTDIAARPKGVQPNDTPDGYGPSDLQSAYDLPSATAGTGTTVAIVDAFDDPTAEADLAVYRTQFGLPACTTANGCFRKVNQQGQSAPLPVPDDGWAGEIALDLDMVSATCPKCNILLVEGNDNSFDALAESVQTAVDLGAKYVSNSYGGPEDPQDLDYNSFYTHPGVVVTASTGDDGYGTSYPATAPGVTAVGGTSLVTASGSRGWAETAWAGAGSGCSDVQAKPSFQTDPGCDMRSVADVSAVADPQTGVAVYVTTGDSGWNVYGGTSASSPIIASVYALAGSPVSGSDPESYPWAAPGALNDVTSGDNGTCSPAYLCTAGPGYDGPTGLGTPAGVAAFRSGPAGTLTGKVTDRTTHAGIAGAQVSAGTSSTTTASDGTYTMSVPVDTYTVTAAAYGYRSASKSGVVVGDGATLTENFALTAVPSHKVSGVVSDGSGHKYPLYAKITVAGTPGAPVYSDPVTGRYELNLPQGGSYSITVDPVLSGYQTTTVTQRVGSSDVTRNIAVPVANGCTAPGYATKYSNGITDFEHGIPSTWTVKDNDGSGIVWTTNDVRNRGNLTGGTGKFAIVDSDAAGSGTTEDTELITPVYNLSSVASPMVGLDSYYKEFSHSIADIDYTVDGGATWTNVWEQTTTTVQGQLSIALPGAANKPAVQVRFHYTGAFDYYWEVDDVWVGTARCAPTPGGLVAGYVTDTNTGKGIVGATVTSNDAPGDTATTFATPDDAAHPDGLYLLFSSKTGSHPLTAAASHYGSVTRSVTITANAAVRADFGLGAGQVTVSPSSITGTATLGSSTTKTVTLTNTGSAPAHVKLGESDGGVVIAGKPAAAAYKGVKGAALRMVKGTYSKQRLTANKGPAAKPTAVSPSDAPWTAIADFPTPISNNSVTTNDGKVYSVGGFDGTDDVASLYVFDPGTNAWTKLADMPQTREAAASGWINGKLYVSGGWGPDASPVADTVVYDPGANSWSAAAANPKPHAGTANTVWEGKLYVIGGCDDTCGNSDVQIYDPVADAWTSGPAFPAASAAWGACGGMDKLYCAGGGANADASKSWSFDGSTWSPIADLPSDAWGTAYGVANGQLLVSGGVVNNSAVTNQGWAYDPNTNAWTALPNSNNAFYRGGGACGFYKVGGSVSSLDPAHAESEVLPGYDNCAGGGADVPWLSEQPSELDLAAGATTTVTVTMDSSALLQPGTYTATLTVSTDTPYPTTSLPVTFTVTPPGSWSKITGVVKGASCSAGTNPLPGATVEIDSWAANYTLTTAADGSYVLWLDRRNNPLTLIAAKDGWKPQTTTATLVKGAPVTVNFTLKPAKAC